MRQTVRLGIVTAIIALVALSATALAAPASSGEARVSDCDIYRVGTPDYDLVLRSCGDVGPLVLERLKWPGGPRADGYYWLPVEEDERDVVSDVIDQVQQTMGEDFPIAVSVIESRPALIDEAARAAVEARVREFLEDRLLTTGTPNLDLAREFVEKYHQSWLDSKYWSEFVGTGYSFDGYCELMVKEENWDIINMAVDELKQMMGDDFPVAVRIMQDLKPL
jgi:hypothetical protein